MEIKSRSLSVTLHPIWYKLASIKLLSNNMQHKVHLPEFEEKKVIDQVFFLGN